VAARDNLVQSTIDLIRRNGVSGTGLTQLTEHSGRSRRTIYLNFPGGKSELVTEATRAAGRAIGSLIDTASWCSSPSEAVDELIDWWKHTLSTSEFAAGCPVVAAALGRSESPSAAAAAGDAFAEWEQALAGRISRTGISAETAIAIATTVVAAIEGAVVMSQAQGTSAPLERVGEQLRILIETQSRLQAP
jgi:TetR/AcrR family transcriptional repressor of lmrAB and yxaGH operons